MMQAFDEVLTALEQRVASMEDTTPTITDERTAAYGAPFVKCQDRINTLHMRLKLLEYENNHEITVPDNGNGPIKLLQTAIVDLATRVTDLESKADEQSDEQIGPTTNLQFTGAFNGTELQIRSNGGQAYYIIAITYNLPDGSILTHTSPSNWEQVNDALATPWSIPQRPAPETEITIYATEDTNYNADRFYYRITNEGDYTINPADWLPLDGYFSPFKLLKRDLYNCFMICCGNYQLGEYTFRLERVPDGWSVVGMYYRKKDGTEASEGGTFGSAAPSSRPWYMWVRNPVKNTEHWIRVKESSSGRIIDIPMSYQNADVLGTWLIYELPRV